MIIDYLYPPPEPPSLVVQGRSERFAVRRILCVGRNYAAHAREMGADPQREAPFFFTKPADALVPKGGELPYPAATADLHHEVELVLALGGGGVDLDPLDAARLVAGFAVGVDLTRRDLQAAAKAKGQPWDAAKGFDFSAPVGALVLGQQPPEGPITLKVNGQLRQSGRLSDMIWSPAEIIAQASRLWRLAPGDLIFTGTPEGVGPLVAGDRVEARAADLPPLGFTIV